MYGFFFDFAQTIVKFTACSNVSKLLKMVVNGSQTINVGIDISTEKNQGQFSLHTLRF